ncbi:PilZ domain-containing protein [Edaphobacter sp.]|jgi:hypothetical protein|uniref:PilZ domain-containing protein n=1 Tax=Edaphobacter sp. TaxID=1934404 RepID=UPI0039C85935
MQKFEYRTPRYPVDLPVLLILKDGSVTGQCREISSEGMKVEFHQPVPTNGCGTLRIGHSGSFLEVRARVARTGLGDDGVKFLFGSERERKALQRLVAQTAAPTGQRGPVLVRQAPAVVNSKAGSRPGW